MTTLPRQPWPTDPDAPGWGPDDFGGEAVYVRCHYSDYPVAEHKRSDPLAQPPPRRSYTCGWSSCSMTFADTRCRPVADSGDQWVREREAEHPWVLIPPEHERLLTTEEQARDRLDIIAKNLGLDHRDSAVLGVTFGAARAEHRRLQGTVAERVATGTAGLVVLAAQQAPPDVLAAVRALDMLILDGMPEVVRDGNPEAHGAIPFLTESFLYPLLGKEDARTVLGLWARVKEAARA